MAIQYEVTNSVNYDEFISVLEKSGLSERRPVDEPERIQKMIQHANLFITAREGEKLVGVARSLTDFSFICYLSDLAVDRAYQNQGIGRKLMSMTSAQAGCRSILLAAPTVIEYYKHCGYKLLDNAFDFTPV